MEGHMEGHLGLKEIKEELKRFLNLESLELEVKIEKGKLVIVKKGKDWERNLHIALFYVNRKLFLTVDLGFFKDKEKVPEELKQRLEELKQNLIEFYKRFCPSVVENIEYIGYYGIKVKEFNTHVCEVIGYVVATLCFVIHYYYYSE